MMEKRVIKAVAEYNRDGALVYAADVPGAFARGQTVAAALLRLPEETEGFLRWAGEAAGPERVRAEIVQWHHTGLCVKDADSEVIFHSERLPMERAEYEREKALVLRSARDFDRLYRLLPDPDATDILPRATFYSKRPCTGREMYVHTNQVTAYYLNEIGLDWENLPDMPENREQALEALERIPGFLDAPAAEGSYGEWWSLRKVMRRFLWHDRIHARAMWRMAQRMWGEAEDIFCVSGREKSKI